MRAGGGSRGVSGFDFGISTTAINIEVDQAKLTLLAWRLLCILIIYHDVRQILAVGANKTYGIGLL